MGCRFIFSCFLYRVCRLSTLAWDHKAMFPLIMPLLVVFNNFKAYKFLHILKSNVNYYIHFLSFIALLVGHNIFLHLPSHMDADASLWKRFSLNWKEDIFACSIFSVGQLFYVPLSTIHIRKHLLSGYFQSQPNPS